MTPSPSVTPPTCRVGVLSGLLQLPHLGWVAFTTALDAAIAG